MDIDSCAAQTGRIMGEDDVYNIVDLLGGGTAVSDRILDIDAHRPQTGRRIGEDGRVYNIVDLLKNLLNRIGSGTGGSISLPSGGKTGAVLTKNSDADGDAVWVLDGQVPWVVMNDPEYEIFEFNGVVGELADEAPWIANLAVMPTARYGLTSSVVDGVIYCIGGTAGSISSQNEAYDPITDTWSVKASMPTGRSGLTSVAINGIIYCIGGTTTGAASGCTSVNEAYDPVTDTWTAKKSIPTGCNNPTSSVVCDVIYCIGGYAGSAGSISTKNEAYDPATNTWNTKKAMPTGREGLTSSTVGGVIYCIGGATGLLNSGVLSVNEAYDPIANTWITKAAVPTGRTVLRSDAVSDIIYCVGGCSGSPLSKNEAYDSATDTWSVKSTMPTARQSLTSSVIGGAIYYIGGTTGSSGLSVNEVFFVSSYHYPEITVEAGDFMIFTKQAFIDVTKQGINPDTRTIALHSGTIYSIYPTLSGIIKRRVAV